MIARRPLALVLAVVCSGVVAAAPWSALVRDRDGKPVADAVVSLHPVDGAPLPDVAPAPVEIAQLDRQYQPYVTPVQVGTVAEFPNRDSIQHHLYSLSKAKRFEKPLYGSGARESVHFDQPGVVTLGCNIHDWMIAYVVVLPTPWFGKTDSAGRALIADVPAGRYRIEVWHPRLAEPSTRERELDGAAVDEEFVLTLKPDRRIRRAPDGGSRGY